MFTAVVLLASFGGCSCEVHSTKEVDVTVLSSGSLVVAGENYGPCTLVELSDKRRGWIKGYRGEVGDKFSVDYYELNWPD